MENKNNEKEALTCLAISIMLKTSERIGNDESASNGRFGITGFQKKHIIVIGNKVHLEYTGKSGVEHVKSFSDELIAKALKKAIKKSPNNYVFCTSNNFRIKSDRVNRYLSDFHITAKDTRGFNANFFIVEKLRNNEIPKTEDERKSIFNKVLKMVALKIGHGKATLKKHYMLPELETDYVNNSKITDLKKLESDTIIAKGGEINCGCKHEEGGEIDKNNDKLLKERLSVLESGNYSICPDYSGLLTEHEYKMRDGGNLDNSEKRVNLVQELINNKIEHDISGTSKIRSGAIIQATSNYLKDSQRTSSEIKGSKLFKEQEAKSLKSYITTNKLWISKKELKRHFNEGAEQDVYLDDDKFVIKTNNSIFYNSWQDYLHSLLLHNYFFPATAYELIGFNDNEGILLAVVKQPFVQETEKTDLEAVKKFMADNGFLNKKNNDYYNPELGIILEDLHEENVLTENGILQFIDTVFYITDSKKEGGLIIVPPQSFLLSTNPSIKDAQVREISSKAIEHANTKESDANILKNGGETTGSDKVISASSRFRPHETIIFEKPLIGINGAKLISYTWAYEWTMTPDREGELKGKRISDWSQAELSADTGKSIVHQFTIELPSGEKRTVSSESVLILLGYTQREQLKSFLSLINALKTLAKQRMQLAIMEAQEKEYKELQTKFELSEKPAIIEIDEPVSFIGVQEDWKEGKHKVFSMGDIWYRQQNDYDYNSRTYKPKSTLNKDTIDMLTRDWILARVKESGGKYPQGIYDLRNRVKRQERKVEQLTESKVEIKMKDGGSVMGNEQVTTENYFLNTTASFTLLFDNKHDSERELKEIIRNNNFKYHISEGGSIYTIKDGIVYRFADHWGQLGSCKWDLIGERKSESFVLASCPLSEFKINKMEEIQFEKGGEMSIPLKKLVGKNWKLDEVAQEIHEGKLSYSKDVPAMVTYIPHLKKYMIMDGYHRIGEQKLEGKNIIKAIINPHQPKTYNVDDENLIQISDYDFNKKMNNGGDITSNKSGNMKLKSELEKGIEVEQEHKETFEKLAEGKISVGEAIVETAQEHINDDKKYYSNMENKTDKMDTKTLIDQLKVYPQDFGVSNDDITKAERFWGMVNVSYLERLHELGFTIDQLRGIIYGINAYHKLKADTEFDYNGIYGLREEYPNKRLAEIITLAQGGIYESALKYPRVEKSVRLDVFEKYQISPTPIIIKSTRKKVNGEETDIMITLYVSKDIIIGQQEDLNSYDPEKKPLDGGYCGIIANNNYILADLLVDLFDNEDSSLKDLDFFYNGMSGVDYENLKSRGILELKENEFHLNNTQMEITHPEPKYKIDSIVTIDEPSGDTYKVIGHENWNDTFGWETRIENTKTGVAVTMFENTMYPAEIETPTLTPMSDEEFSIKIKEAFAEEVEQLNKLKLEDEEAKKKSTWKRHVDKVLGEMMDSVEKEPSLYPLYAEQVLSLPKGQRSTLNPYEQDLWDSEPVKKWIEESGKNLLDFLPVEEYSLPKYKPFETTHEDNTFMRIHGAFSGADDLRPVMMGTNFSALGVATTDANVLLFTPFRGNEHTDKPKTYCHKKQCFENQEQIDEKQYPNYKQIIPRDVASKHILNAHAIYNYLKNLENLKLFNQTTHQFIIEYSVDGENKKVGFNAMYFLLALEGMAKLGHTDLEIGITSASRASLIYPAKSASKALNFKEDFTIIMPVMIGEGSQPFGNMFGSTIYNIDTNCFVFEGSENKYCFDLEQIKKNKEVEKTNKIATELEETKNKLAKTESVLNEVLEADKTKTQAEQQKIIDAEKEVNRQAELARIKEELDKDAIVMEEEEKLANEINQAKKGESETEQMTAQDYKDALDASNILMEVSDDADKKEISDYIAGLEIMYEMKLDEEKSNIVEVVEEPVSKPTKSKKATKTIEEATNIIPEVVAERPAEDYIYLYKFKKELDNYVNLDKKAKAELDKKVRAEVEKVQQYLVDRAETHYKHNENFRKNINGKGNTGLNYLRMFMNHWAGNVDGKIQSIEISMSNWYKEAGKKSGFEIIVTPKGKGFKPHVWTEGGVFPTKESAEFQAKSIRKMRNQYSKVEVVPVTTQFEDGGEIVDNEMFAKGGSLDKLWNLPNYGITSYRNLIDKGLFVGKNKSIENAIKFDRTKYNRMDGDEQKEYYKKLNKKKTVYNLILADDSSFEVSKEVYDYANITEIPEQSFYMEYKAEGGEIETEMSYKDFDSLYRKFYAKEHPMSGFPRPHVLGSFYDDYLKKPSSYAWLLKYKSEELKDDIDGYEKVGDYYVNKETYNVILKLGDDIHEVHQGFSYADAINWAKEESKIKDFKNVGEVEENIWDRPLEEYDGNMVPKSKFNVDDMVYSWQNPDEPRRVSFKRFEKWLPSGEKHPNDQWKFKVSLVDGEGYTKSSKWMGEGSLSLEKKDTYEGGGSVEGFDEQDIRKGVREGYDQVVSGVVINTTTGENGVILKNGNEIYGSYPLKYKSEIYDIVQDEKGKVDNKEIVLPDKIANADIGIYLYKGGNNEIDEFIKPDTFVNGFPIGDYIGFLPFGGMIHWFLFPKHYFEYKSHETWWDGDYDITSVKNLPIKIYGENKKSQEKTPSATKQKDLWLEGKEKEAFELFVTDSGNPKKYTFDSYKRVMDYALKGIQPNPVRLNGKQIEVHTLGVPEPTYYTIKSVHITPEHFEKRIVTLFLKEGGVEIFKLEKLSDFMKGEEVEIKDSKGEPYVISLVEHYDGGGEIMEDGNLEDIVLKGYKEELESIKGQLAYLDEAISSPNTEAWEKKEYESVREGVLVRQKEIKDHLSDYELPFKDGGEVGNKKSKGKFDPTSLIGKKVWSSGGSMGVREIISVIKYADDNIHVKLQVTPTLTSEESYTIDELSDLNKGKIVRKLELLSPEKKSLGGLIAGVALGVAGTLAVSKYKSEYDVTPPKETKERYKGKLPSKLAQWYDEKGATKSGKWTGDIFPKEFHYYYKFNDKTKKWEMIDYKEHNLIFISGEYASGEGRKKFKEKNKTTVWKLKK